MKKIEHIEEVNYTGNTLVVTYKKGENNLGNLIEFLKRRKSRI